MGIFPSGVHVSHAWCQSRLPAFLSPEIHPNRTVCFWFYAPHTGEARLNTQILPEAKEGRKMPPVCGFAPGMRSEVLDERNVCPYADPEFTNRCLNLLRIGCGTDDGLYGVVAEYMQVRDEIAIHCVKNILRLLKIPG